ncbi:MAG TPA: ABC transporter ATP-binding protein [Myxococcota bacterium]|nr:ABC transporter ATP-binding protein [Myxococcota bacterium]
MIEAENVTKYYGAHAAVRDLSFNIAEGEVVGLLGLNGAGKTTTLRILSGLLVPTSGTVRVGGLDMAREPEAARALLGFLPETPPLYPEMTVADYLTFAARIKGVHQGLADALEQTLAATDLTEVRDERLGTLSHGYHRRAGIAQAIIHKPALILLDEPTSGLDPVQVVHMRKLIRNLRGKNTIMVSSHILGEIHQLCDRIFVLQEGRIAAEGNEEQLAARVAQTTRVSVEVRGDRQRLVVALGKAGAVSHAIEREGEGVTAATVELQTDSREELARLLVQEGLGLRRLERVRLELESIFLQLTGGAQGKEDRA